MGMTAPEKPGSPMVGPTPHRMPGAATLGHEAESGQRGVPGFPQDGKRICSPHLLSRGAHRRNLQAVDTVTSARALTAGAVLITDGAARFRRICGMLGPRA